MSENKKMDWSYNSMSRYIVDLHIWLLVTIVVAYLFEPIEDYLMIKQIITLWLLSILMWLMLRLTIFLKRKNTQKEEERCAAQVELTKETERILLKYAYKNDLLLSEVVDEALHAYVEKNEDLLENRDVESSS